MIINLILNKYNASGLLNAQHSSLKYDQMRLKSCEMETFYSKLYGITFFYDWIVHHFILIFFPHSHTKHFIWLDSDGTRCVMLTHCLLQKLLPVRYHSGKSLLVLHCYSLRTSAFAKQRICNGRYYLNALIATSYCRRCTHLKYKSNGVIYLVIITQQCNLYIHYSSTLGRSTCWYFGVTQF